MLVTVPVEKNFASPGLGFLQGKFAPEASRGELSGWPIGGGVFMIMCDETEENRAEAAASATIDAETILSLYF